MSKQRAMHEFDKEIKLALAESRILLAIISRNTLRSKWVAEEVTS